ncbi:serine protease [Corallococcus sp. CA049B]|uniref:trypsin-like serine peptidase n=1 Tax=Corallococcus sp. CA049B TaxID=2316730 RepID=UPI00351AA05A
MTGPIENKGYRCVGWNEPADPHAWSDNYLCARPHRPTGTTTQQLPLKGGTTTSSQPAVGRMEFHMDGWSKYCTATLVAPRIALTAAHCVGYKSTAIGTYGTVDFGASGKRTVVQARPFGSNTGKSDVALVVLDKACSKKITPVPIGTAVPSDGTEISIFGFGCASESTTCVRAGGNTKQVVTATIGESAVLCPGDSGGPVLVAGKIVGVNSARWWLEQGDVFGNPTTASIKYAMEVLPKDFPCASSHGCADGTSWCNLGVGQCMPAGQCLELKRQGDDACLPPKVKCLCPDHASTCTDKSVKCASLCPPRKILTPKD